jgi:hypothetical protein
MAETTLERARAIGAAHSYLAEFRTLAAKYAANVERALGREGMCEVSGIAMEVRERTAHRREPVADVVLGSVRRLEGVWAR